MNSEERCNSQKCNLIILIFYRFGGITDGVGGITDGEASLDDEANASCFSLSLHFVDKLLIKIVR